MSREFGPHQADGPIAKGAMCEVWRSRDTLAGEDVIVMVVPAAARLTPALRTAYCEQLARRSEIAKGLRHPNLVRTFGHGIADDGAPYVVMELVDGKSLHDLLHASGVLDQNYVARAGHGVASALLQIHAAGLVHGDVRPGTLLHDGADGSVKLTGLGVPEPSAAMVAEQPSLAFSSLYAAPEIVGAGEVGPAADLFSLGVTAYEALTGKHPFARQTSADTKRAIAHDTVPPASWVRSQLGEGWDALLSRAMARKVSERFPDAHAMAEAFMARIADVSSLTQPIAPLSELDLKAPSRHESPLTTQPIEWRPKGTPSAIATAPMADEGEGSPAAPPDRPVSEPTRPSKKPAAAELAPGRSPVAPLSQSVSTQPLGPAPDPPVASPAKTAAGPPLDLLVVEGPDRGKRIALDESIEIGRDAGQLPLRDDTVSRRHCRVARIADKVYLTDHGSLNGTWLKSGRVQVAEITVNTLFAVGTYTKIRLLSAESRR